MPSALSPAAALAVIDAIRQHFAQRLAQKLETPALTAELAKVLTLLENVDFTQPDAAHLRATRHPVITQLKSLAAAKMDDAILAACLPHLARLPWRYSYDARADHPGLETRMAWAELVGPIAPFKSQRVCLGLTAIGPHTLYPAHIHPAVETYLVLSGTARWAMNDLAQTHPPGTLILHPSNVVHVMQTDTEPLLAAYAWTGDVKTLSHYLERDG
ncbi:MAG: AraC family ligand binding domain-containing protein [Zoogloeaceae bacterium]|jgi:quercetin dioxygenase-like cupin family protein|nr:AraC family ligand binding domain-containing protein [Zoogloeaceae bacterium]